MSQSSAEALQQAITRNSAAVLSLPSAGMLRNIKTRFLGDCEEGIWLESEPAQRVLVDELIERATPAGISFRGGTLRVAFVVRILRRDQNFRMNDTSSVEAVLVEKPEELKAIQRRHWYRVHVPEDSDVSVRIWSIPEQAYINDRPLAAQEISAKLRNLSVGGIGVVLSGSTERPLNLSAGDRLRIELKCRGTVMILEGRVRHPTRASKEPLPQYFGIQFAKLENNIEGRQNLAFMTAILGELQREEVRRCRLGVA